MGFEPTTFGLGSRHSTTELRPQKRLFAEIYHPIGRPVNGFYRRPFSLRRYLLYGVVFGQAEPSVEVSSSCFVDVEDFVGAFGDLSCFFSRDADNSVAVCDDDVAGSYEYAAADDWAIDGFDLISSGSDSTAYFSKVQGDLFGDDLVGVSCGVVCDDSDAAGDFPAHNVVRAD